MNQSTEEKTQPRRTGGWGWFILICGCIVFGILMSTRTEFESHLARAFVAACAAFVLGLAISQSKKFRK